MSSILAVLFDCDGVIADSEESWNEIDREHLQHYGVPDYRGQYKPQVIGKSFLLAGGFYRDFFKIEVPLEEMVEQRTGVAAKFYAETIPTFAGVTDVLVALRERGLKLALATSSVGALIHPFLERNDIAQYFDFVVTGEQVEHGKPHPDIYLKAAAGVGTEPGQCLVVEDALAGLQAGRSAGCQTVAIPDARWLDPKEFEGKADFQIENISELLELVSRLR
ncbi:hexitol phosphatase B [Abditibacteriota bacterium]|nr:hexitol phosphatase B [Abditibacteriota bacterium]